jgi:NADH-quinone oxidoreductase subunit G
LGGNVEDLENADAILVVGSNLRKEVPIIAHRVRKAAVAGAEVNLINTEAYEYFFDTHEHLHGVGLVAELAGVVVAAAGSRKLPASVATLCAGVTATASQKHIAKSLSGADNAIAMTGLVAGRHGAASAIRALLAAIGELTGATIGTLSEGANSAGGHLAGVLPHRSRGGEARSESGLSAADMLAGSMDVSILLGLEPEDLTSAQNAIDSLNSHKFVVALTPFTSASLESAANLMLPIGTFAETSGTYVNCEGRWQSFAGIANPVGESRPAWKVLRVLGNLLDLDGFEFLSTEEVRDDLSAMLGDIQPDNAYNGSKAIAQPNGADDPASAVDVPIYQVDSLVRRATALQLTPEAIRWQDEKS